MVMRTWKLFLYVTLLFYECNPLKYNVKEDAELGYQIEDLSTEGCSQYVLERLKGCCKVEEGKLLVDKVLDYETTSYYSGTLKCYLNATPYIKEFTIEVTISDVNDNEPFFEPDVVTVRVEENNQEGKVENLQGATDNDDQAYSVRRYELSAPSEFFEVRSGSWYPNTLPLNLVLKKELDYDKGSKYYNLTVIAYDSDNKSGELTLNVEVIDKNDNKPVFSPSDYNVTVVEHTSLRSVVTRVAATDADSGDNGEITFTMSDKTTPFEIKSNGEIVIFKDVDREVKDAYLFDVIATDHGEFPLSSKAIVKISVLDINDNPPEILEPLSLFVAQVSESNDSDIFVCSVRIRDKDYGVNATLTVQLVGIHSNKFKYKKGLGELGEIVTNAPLDREDISLYTLKLLVKDGGTPQQEKEVQFQVNVTDVNDNPPVFLNCRTVTIKENTVGAALFTVETEDADVGVNAEVGFSIVGANNRYDINDRGQLTLKEEYDYEQVKTDVVEIKATDKASKNPLSALCNLSIEVEDVNDNPPYFTNIDKPISVKEDTKAGVGIFNVEVGDVDTVDKDKLTLTLQTYTDTFHLSGNQLSLQQSKSLDREKKDSYIVVIKLCDSDDLHCITGNITVLVEDVSDTKPTWQNIPHIVHLSDTLPIGTVIYTLKVGDLDISDTHTYSISNNPYYEVNEVNGDVTIKTVNKIQEINITKVYTVTASDGVFTIQGSLTFIIYRNVTNPPVITSFSDKVVSEDIKLNTLITKCTATSTSPLTYTLVTPLPGPFQMASASGEVTLKQHLDYEVTGSRPYKVTCRASNIHNIYTDKTTAISVEGVNEFPPAFNSTVYNIITDDNNKQDRIIGKVTATDKDKGVDGYLLYYLVGDYPEWAIKPSSGEIIQLGKKQSESKRSAANLMPVKRANENNFKSLTLIVGVKDSPKDESTSMNTTAKVVINVEPYASHLTGNKNIYIFGIAGGAGFLLIILIVIVLIIIIRKRRHRSGSKTVTFVNPTSVTDNKGRVINPENQFDVQLREITPHYERDKQMNSYVVEDSVSPLSYSDKLTPHKQSVSTVLSDLKKDGDRGEFQREALRQSGLRPPLSVALSTSYDSLHHFGSEGGGEGDAMIDIGSLFRKIPEIEDDASVIGKHLPFLGDQDSAISSLGSSNSGDKSVHCINNDYKDWKNDFQNLSKQIEHRNKQFAYNKSSRSTTPAPSVTPPVARTPPPHPDYLTTTTTNRKSDSTDSFIHDPDIASSRI